MWISFHKPKKNIHKSHRVSPCFEGQRTMNRRVFWGFDSVNYSLFSEVNWTTKPSTTTLYSISFWEKTPYFYICYKRTSFFLGLLRSFASPLSKYCTTASTKLQPAVGMALKNRNSYLKSPLVRSLDHPKWLKWLL